METCYATIIVGNKKDIWVDARTCYAYVNPIDTTNYKEVDFDGVNSITIFRDDNGVMTIILASGWTYDRGIFCDMYSSITGTKVCQFK